MIEISENLRNFTKLTKLAGYKTYVVGGYVRNSLLNLSINDVDIAGSMPMNEVISLCKKNGYGVTVINKKLGTLLITKDDEKYEFTAFRQEIYDESGKHKPDEVKFVDDPKLDAIRRDFTINAFYYDVEENKVLDFFNAEHDLKKRLLKTVTNPETVFTDDGLRILRLIRFTCELGFKPERNTLKVAKEFSFKVADISKERVLREIKIAINGGLKYHLKNETHGNVVKYFNSFNLWQYILNSAFKDFKIKPYGRMYKAYLKSDGSCRYIAFMCMILQNYIKAKSSDTNIEFSVNQILGLGGLKESNKNMMDVYNAYVFAQKLLYFNDEDITENHVCLQYDKLPFETKTYLSLVNVNKINKIKLRIMQLKKAKVPFKEEELKITNAELINDAKVLDEFVSKIRNTLFEMCVEGIIINDREILFEQAKFLNEKLLKLLANAKKRSYEKSKQNGKD